MAQPEWKAIGLFVAKPKFFNQELEKGNKSRFGPNELAHEVQVDQPLAQVFCGSVARVFLKCETAFCQGFKVECAACRDLDKGWTSS